MKVMPAAVAFRASSRFSERNPHPGVDGIRSRIPCDLDDGVRVQVRLYGVPSLADFVCFIGLQPVQRSPVLIGVNRDSARTHLIRRTKCSDRDLPAVGHQNLLKHAHLPKIYAHGDHPLGVG